MIIPITGTIPPTPQSFLIRTSPLASGSRHYEQRKKLVQLQNGKCKTSGYFAQGPPDRLRHCMLKPGPSTGYEPSASHRHGQKWTAYHQTPRLCILYSSSKDPLWKLGVGLLADQNVWTVVPLPPPRCNIVGSKWVYKIIQQSLLYNRFFCSTIRPEPRVELATHYLNVLQLKTLRVRPLNYHNSIPVYGVDQDTWTAAPPRPYTSTEERLLYSM